jgi:hydroxymethylbilane synthase
MTRKVSPCRIGTRKSLLATTQSKQVLKLLEDQNIPCELVLIESEGDIDRTTPLYEIETSAPGLFTKQLEQALLDGRIDVAVHSLKDLPTLQPEGLKVACLPPRVITADCIIASPKAIRAGSMPLGLREGATVGTSSLRREAQLLSVRPDLKITPIRGNVPTRIDAVRKGKLDAVVLAEAGLFRLNLLFKNEKDVIKVPLPVENFVPAPGQGALALEVRADDENQKGEKGLISCMSKIHHIPTEIETRIERRILRELEGGCTLPLGVRCVSKVKEIALSAFLGVLKDTGGVGHTWSSFHHFELRDSTEDTLVRKTVDFFRGVM